ncbi:protein of unknown function [Candidatus Methylomirabilis oxygeniifera]|uniref:Uncharacterized protein n=1 Tax=Methylomirabilis oxygeniifera TaxID=671143 RepID=D5ML75_METO1|nr:protein of unknown function [Candidatus Methylomirabilis oxyfera]
MRQRSNLPLPFLFSPICVPRTGREAQGVVESRLTSLFLNRNFVPNGPVSRHRSRRRKKSC